MKLTDIPNQYEDETNNVLGLPRPKERQRKRKKKKHNANKQQK